MAATITVNRMTRPMIDHVLVFHPDRADRITGQEVKKQSSAKYFFADIFAEAVRGLRVEVGNISKIRIRRKSVFLAVIDIIPGKSGS